jgi:hypothetical protein
MKFLTQELISVINMEVASVKAGGNRKHTNTDVLILKDRSVPIL